MTSTLQIEKADLYADWVTVARQRLINSGFDVSHLLTSDAVSLEYFNALLHLTIPTQPRRVHKATAFACPAEQAAGLAIFEVKAAAGESLRPHMSRGAKKVSNRDGLRYDWGIHHFHLGAELEADGFVKRTGPVLFAMVQQEDIYLLNVMPHGAWNQQQVLQLVWENWPYLLEPYRFGPTVKGLGHYLTDEEIALARKHHIVTALRMADGVFVMPPGGGMTTSGHSMNVVDHHMQNHQNLMQLTKNIYNLTSQFVTEPLQDGTISNPILYYSLVEYDGSQYGLEEANNGFHYILTGPPGLPLL